MMNAALLLNKPVGITSRKAIDLVANLLKTKKIGHGGTLDPLAHGLLIALIGKGTKIFPYLQLAAKTYKARIALGVGTDTLDLEGNVIQTMPVPSLGREELRNILAGFEGDIIQEAPIYSALKVGGKPMHKLARRGEKVVPRRRKVHIDKIELIGYNKEFMEISVTCSAGAYIRSLARDIAHNMGTCGHLAELERTKIGSLTIERSYKLDDLPEIVASGSLRLTSLSRVLDFLESIVLDESQAANLVDGKMIKVRSTFLLQDANQDKPVRMLAPDGSLLALGRVSGCEDEKQLISPSRVLVNKQDIRSIYHLNLGETPNAPPSDWGFF